MAARPILDELARRDDNVYSAASKYAQLLAPDDTVLEQKGRDYKVYREVLRDDQCASMFAQRRLGVVSKGWVVNPASDAAQDVAAADFIREQLDALDWDNVTDLMLYARWYGHAVAEVMWALDGNRITIADIIVRDRARFAYDDQHNVWLFKQGKMEQMPPRKFWTIATGADHDDSPYGLGLAHYCYWPVFFKRNGIKFWMVFLEKFGMPTAKGTVPAGRLDDVQFRTKALEALNAIASQTAVLVPEGMEIELIEAARSGASTYEEMTRAMDAAIAKLVIGQTASGEGTPGRLGNDDLQATVREELCKADADLVCGSFNRQVVAWLTDWNFPGAKPPKVWRDIEPQEDMTERAERDTKIFGLGFEPTEDYITQTYGEGWQRRAVRAGVNPAEVPSQLAQEFAELGALAAMKMAHRGDQAALADAATAFANRYDDIIGTRVQELLNLAEETGDYETMGKRLRELMAEQPPEQTQQALLRGGFFARLMGMLRLQR